MSTLLKLLTDNIMCKLSRPWLSENPKLMYNKAENEKFEKGIFTEATIESDKIFFYLIFID